MTQVRGGKNDGNCDGKILYKMVLDLKQNKELKVKVINLLITKF